MRLVSSFNINSDALNYELHWRILLYRFRCFDFRAYALSGWAKRNGKGWAYRGNFFLQAETMLHRSFLFRSFWSLDTTKKFCFCCCGCWRSKIGREAQLHYRLQRRTWLLLFLLLLILFFVTLKKKELLGIWSRSCPCAVSHGWTTVQIIISLRLGLERRREKRISFAFQHEWNIALWWKNRVFDGGPVSKLIKSLQEMCLQN